MAPRSLRLWSASQRVTPGLAPAKPRWPHFTWARISIGVCLGPGVIPPLQNSMILLRMSLEEGTLIPFKAILRHPLALQTEWTFFPLPTLSIPGQ